MKKLLVFVFFGCLAACSSGSSRYFQPSGPHSSGPGVHQSEEALVRWHQ